MPGRVAAPAPAPLFGFAGQTPLSASGLLIVPGVGLVGRTDVAAHSLLLDGQSPLPGGELCACYPGSPAVTALLSKFTNPSPSGSVFVNVVDASLRVAPSGADGTNNLAVRVTGATGGLGDVPLTTTWQSLDFATPTQVAGNTTYSSYVAEQQSGNTIRGRAVGFRVSANKTIASITFLPRDGGSGSTALDGYGLNWLTGGVPKVLELMDRDLTVLAAVPTTRAFTDSIAYTFVLPTTVALAQNRTYYVGIRRTDVGYSPAGVIVRGITPGTASGLFAGTTDGYTGSAATGWGTIHMYSGAASDATWKSLAVVDSVGARIVSAGTVPAGAPAGTERAYCTDQSQALGVKLNGSSGGFLASGAITVGLVQNGTGPTTPGTDLNVRVSVSGA